MDVKGGGEGGDFTCYVVLCCFIMLIRNLRLFVSCRNHGASFTGVPHPVVSVYTDIHCGKHIPSLPQTR